MSRAGIVFLGALLAAAAGAVAQQPAAQTPAQAETTAVLEGLVVAEASGEPLRKANIVLRPAAEPGRQPPRGSTRMARSDAEGRFALRDVPPGRYRLFIERSGYARREYGQRSLNRPGTPLELRPGQQVRDLVFRLVRAGVVSGRIFDPDGDPVVGARVSAMRTAYVRGQRQLMPAESDQTDDRGEYRLHGLTPGRYYISVAVLPLRIGPGENPSDESFLPTFYPGTTDPAAAAPLEVRAGDEIPRLDLTVAPVAGVRVSGRVIEAATGQPARNTQVMLLPRQAGISALSSFVFGLRDSARDGGEFEIRGVPPGSYFLIAMQFSSDRQLSARLPVEVGGTNVEGLMAAVAPGIEVRGRVTVEGSAQTSLENLRVSTSPREGMVIAMGGVSGPATVAADGSFTLRNVQAMALDLAMSNLPEGYYLKAARLGRRDVLEDGLELAAAPAETLELVLSDAGGRVEGLVLDDESLPAPAATVVLVPEASRRRVQRLYRNVVTDAQGRFVINGIPPGEYKLFAFEDAEQGAWLDPEFLEPFERRGSTVRLEERSRHSTELKLLRAAASP